MKSLLLDALFGARKRTGKNDGITDGERIPGVRLGRVYINPIETREACPMEPRAICQKGVAAQVGDR